MSLRSKVIGVLLIVLGGYAVSAWFVLSYIQGRSFIELERAAATDQLSRGARFFESERERLELLAVDWGSWDDAWRFATDPNYYDKYYSTNLIDGYVGTLGIDFGIVVNRDGQVVWGESYSSNGGVVYPIETLFPAGIAHRDILLKPTSYNDKVSGFVGTDRGSAIVVSTAILHSDDSGPAAGQLMFGKLLDDRRLNKVSRNLIAPVDLLPVDRTALPQHYHVAFDALLLKAEKEVVVSTEDHTYALSLINDVAGEPIAVLRVGTPRTITHLGIETITFGMVMLVIASLLVTICIWFMLKGMMLSPIERLTVILREFHDNHGGRARTPELSSTVKALSRWQDSMSSSSREDEIGKLVQAFQILSVSLREATNQIWRIAHIDGLTELANRRLFIERLQNECELALGCDSQVAVLFIDLDGFKQVNDQFGHRAGDDVLVGVAARLKRLVQLSEPVGEKPNDELRDLPARIGGDEFVVMLSGKALAPRAEKVASNIVEELGRPFPLLSGQCDIGASVGYALFPDDGSSVDDILHLADGAMYSAKNSGKGTWRRSEIAAERNSSGKHLMPRVRTPDRRLK